MSDQTSDDHANCGICRGYSVGSAMRWRPTGESNPFDRSEEQRSE